MKKILIMLMLVLGFSGAMYAQQTKKDKAKATSTAAAPVTAAKVPLKKDGTPDKRFKANKAGATAPAGPLKKDGTPDKRFKANKKG